MTAVDPDRQLPKSDRGSGSFGDYSYGLLAKNRRIRMFLADSDPHQEELRALVENGDARAETAISPRSQQQEAVDAAIVVRLFTGRRVSAPVGSVPRGLESVVDENLRRLDDAFGVMRIPVEIVRKRGVYRVALLMGEVREKLR